MWLVRFFVFSSKRNFCISSGSSGMVGEFTLIFSDCLSCCRWEQKNRMCCVETVSLLQSGHRGLGAF